MGGDGARGHFTGRFCVCVKESITGGDGGGGIRDSCGERQRLRLDGFGGAGQGGSGSRQMQDASWILEEIEGVHGIGRRTHRQIDAAGEGALHDVSTRRRRTLRPFASLSPAVGHSRWVEVGQGAW